MELPLDRRPLIVALAGAKRGRQIDVYHAHLQLAGLRFVNADVLARALNINPYDAANVADSLRRELVRQRESFVFETVFSDLAGDKLGFLRDAAAAGSTVVLCFIVVSGRMHQNNAWLCESVSQGGHDVPTEKLESRYPRTMANLKTALLEIPPAWIFDNDDLRVTYRLVAVYEHGQLVAVHKPMPWWLTT